MTTPEFDPLDCPFHAAALAAYLEQAALCGGRPDSLDLTHIYFSWRCILEWRRGVFRCRAKG